MFLIANWAAVRANHIMGQGCSGQNCGGLRGTEATVVEVDVLFNTLSHSSLLIHYTGMDYMKNDRWSHDSVKYIVPLVLW